jgi:Flp pilus assembly protein CpaB
VAIALAGATAMIVSAVVRTAEARSARYGDIVLVPVATRPLRLGATVRSGDITMRAMPRAFVPEGAVVRDATGRTVIVPVVAGEVVLAAKLAPAGLNGVAALLRPGERALAVPVGPGTPPLALGDRVDVLATAPDSGTTALVADGARVLGIDERAVTIAVRPANAAPVAAALAAGTITLALAAP